MFKKFFCILLVAVIVSFALAGCTKASTPKKPTDAVTKEVNKSSESVESDTEKETADDSTVEKETNAPAENEGESKDEGISEAESEKAPEEESESDDEGISEAESEEAPESEEEKVSEAESEKAPESEPADVPVTPSAEPSTLKVYEAASYEMYAGLPNYVVYESEYAVPVIFQSEGEISDFEIYSVEMTNGYDELGVKAIGGISLRDNERIVVMLDFPGDMSSWYYSYVNNKGQKCEYMIYMSGMDGSIVSTSWN